MALEPNIPDLNLNANYYKTGVEYGAFKVREDTIQDADSTAANNIKKTTGIFKENIKSFTDKTTNNVKNQAVNFANKIITAAKDILGEDGSSDCTAILKGCIEEIEAAKAKSMTNIMPHLPSKLTKLERK